MGPDFFDQAPAAEGAGGGERPAEQAAVPRLRYVHPLDYYGPHFQRLLGLPDPPVRTRAIKRWIKIGRSAVAPKIPAPPPLDEPWRLASWWSTYMAQCVPPWLSALAKQRPDENGPRWGFAVRSSGAVARYVGGDITRTEAAARGERSSAPGRPGRGARG